MATGQLSSTLQTIEGQAGNPHPITLTLFNTDSVTDQVTLQLTPASGATRTMMSFPLGPGEWAVLSGLYLAAGDSVGGYATNPAVVNWVTNALQMNYQGSLSFKAYDNNGRVKEFANVISGLTFTGLLVQTAADNLTATGTAKGTALQLSAQKNRIVTASATTSPYSGVVLPQAIAGTEILVNNASPNPITVYGFTGTAGTDSIGLVSGSVGVIQPPSTMKLYHCFSSGVWWADGPRL